MELDMILIIANALCLFLEAISDKVKTKSSKITNVLNIIIIVLLVAAIYWRVNHE